MSETLALGLDRPGDPGRGSRGRVDAALAAMVGRIAIALTALDVPEGAALATLDPGPPAWSPDGGVIGLPHGEPEPVDRLLSAIGATAADRDLLALSLVSHHDAVVAAALRTLHPEGRPWVSLGLAAVLAERRLLAGLTGRADLAATLAESALVDAGAVTVEGTRSGAGAHPAARSAGVGGPDRAPGLAARVRGRPAACPRLGPGSVVGHGPGLRRATRHPAVAPGRLRPGRRAARGHGRPALGPGHPRRPPARRAAHRTARRGDPAGGAAARRAAGRGAGAVRDRRGARSPRARRTAPARPAAGGVLDRRTDAVATARRLPADHGPTAPERSAAVRAAVPELPRAQAVGSVTS